jgi:hypothetical protein
VRRFRLRGEMQVDYHLCGYLRISKIFLYPGERGSFLTYAGKYMDWGECEI